MFCCKVCFEVCNTRLALPRLTTINSQTLRAEDCNHPVCQECMAKFVISRVEEQLVFGIRCPIEGCRNELYDQDVQRLVKFGSLSADIGKRFADLRRRNYSARASSFTSVMDQQDFVDYGLLKTLWATTRRCPRCDVIIQKSEGCNSFGCVCGHRFNFSKAPRGCFDDVENFECVLDLAQQFELPLQVAKDQVANGSSKGITNYRVVTRYAKQEQITLNAAEFYAQAFHGRHVPQLEHARTERRLAKKIAVLMARSDLSSEDAQALLEQAYAGDVAAQEQVKRIRQNQP